MRTVLAIFVAVGLTLIGIPAGYTQAPAQPAPLSDARVTESWSGRFQWSQWERHPGWWMLYRDGKLWYCYDQSTKQWHPWQGTAWGKAETHANFPPETKP